MMIAADGRRHIPGCLMVFVLAVLLAWGCAGKPNAKTRPSNAPTTRATTGSTAPAPTAAPPAGAATSSAPAPATAAAGTPGASAAPRPPAPPPLIGHVTRDDLENYVTWKELRAQDYTPDAGHLSTITSRVSDVSVLAIVATWCGDSKRQVPRFFKLADQAGLKMSAITLVAVDRSKKDAEGLTEKYAVTRVPTFLFFRNGTEIGRITEKPATTLEQEMAAILAGPGQSVSSLRLP